MKVTRTMFSGIWLGKSRKLQIAAWKQNRWFSDIYQHKNREKQYPLYVQQCHLHSFWSPLSILVAVLGGFQYGGIGAEPHVAFIVRHL